MENVYTGCDRRKSSVSIFGGGVQIQAICLPSAAIACLLASMYIIYTMKINEIPF